LDNAKKIACKIIVPKAPNPKPSMRYLINAFSIVALTDVGFATAVALIVVRDVFNVFILVKVSFIVRLGDNICALIGVNNSPSVTVYVEGVLSTAV